MKKIIDKHKKEAYGSVYAELYDHDTWYTEYNYSENTQRIVALVEDFSITSLLELASGTGSYLPEFLRYYAHVEGLEISTHMRDISLKKYPKITVHLGDMTNFQLGQRYDAITLLNGSIAHAAKATQTESVLAIRNMIRCCREHLNSKGIVIIEDYAQTRPPTEWVKSMQYTLEDKYVSQHLVKTIESTNFVIVTCHFLVTPKKPSASTTYTQETHRIHLYETEKLISLFEEEKFSLKLRVSSFAMEERDLLIFQLTEI